MLDERGWETVIIQESANYVSFPGIAVPVASKQCFQLPYYTFQGSWPRCPLSYYQTELYLSAASSKAKTKATNNNNSNSSGNKTLKICKDILQHVSSLSNHVTFNGSLKALNKLKDEKREYFSRIDLYLSVQRMISQYNNGFSFSVRRYIENLFHDAMNSHSGRGVAFLAEIDELIETIDVTDDSVVQKMEEARLAAIAAAASVNNSIKDTSELV